MFLYIKYSIEHERHSGHSSAKISINHTSLFTKFSLCLLWRNIGQNMHEPRYWEPRDSQYRDVFKNMK